MCIYVATRIPVPPFFAGDGYWYSRTRSHRTWQGRVVVIETKDAAGVFLLLFGWGCFPLMNMDCSFWRWKKRIVVLIVSPSIRGFRYWKEP